MLDRNAFMETLRAVAEVTRTAQNGLSKEEILKYFEGMELTEEHKEMIYQYMLLPPEVQTAEPEAEPEEEVKPVETEEGPDYFQMYLNEVKDIEELSEEEMDAAYSKLLAGDTSVIGAISESWLSTIAELAMPYAEQGISVQDVIQEGNMGLLLKLSELVGAGEISGIGAILEGAVTSAMMAYALEEKENYD